MARFSWSGVSSDRAQRSGCILDGANSIRDRNSRGLSTCTSGLGVSESGARRSDSFWCNAYLFLVFGIGGDLSYHRALGRSLDLYCEWPSLETFAGRAAPAAPAPVENEYLL